MSLQKINILNQHGEQLSAQLQLPVGQKVAAYALFAHCFTCNKNLSAIKNIVRALNQQGIAVMSFDFTGLGASEGEFADTNFSTNVRDLAEVAGYMKEKGQAPQLIIGHSLGGAAAIAASAQIGSVEAVATVGAPASPGHVTHLFESSLNEIEQEGVAKVSIGERPFLVKKQFLDDVAEANIKAVLNKSKKPILILHSPIDQIVSVDNAAEIYQAAQHPKSFISLGEADHLLTRKDDSLYVGEMIASWAKRYIQVNQSEQVKSNQQVAVRLGGDGYTTEIVAGKHRLIADEPASVGGDDLGASPYDLLLASLGACTAMTLKMYANRKQWQLGEVLVELNHSKEYSRDCVECEKNTTKIDVVQRSISIAGNLTAEQQSRLLEIADKCPVHKTLHNKVEVRTELV